MHAAARCAPQSLMLRLCRSLKRKPEFNERSITDFVVLLQGVKDAYTCPIYAMNRTTKSAIYVMELTVMG